MFEELLLDADWSVNAGSWMWLSCSSFFQQFFHCYCPVGFGRRTDPNGDYIRWVAFQSDVPAALLVACAAGPRYHTVQPHCFLFVQPVSLRSAFLHRTHRSPSTFKPSAATTPQSQPFEQQIRHICKQHTSVLRPAVSRPVHSQRLVFTMRLCGLLSPLPCLQALPSCSPRFPCQVYL